MICFHLKIPSDIFLKFITTGVYNEKEYLTAFFMFVSVKYRTALNFSYKLPLNPFSYVA